MTSLPYEVVDVFTDQPFTGNPLAVVFDADGLTVAQMQAIAREFQLSETVFVLPPSDPGATYRARIFTPTAEIPFAGHPSIGAAVTVARRGVTDADDVGSPVVGAVVQECGAGLLPLTVHDDRATLTGAAPTVGPELDPEPLLALAGLQASDFAGPAPRSAGCGLEFPYLSVHPDAIGRARCDPIAADRYGVSQVSVFAWDTGARTAHTRVFVPGLGVPEDPATGSAALGLGVWLVTSGLLPGDGRSTYLVRQGTQLRRPSRLDCSVTAEAGVAVSATVAGQVVQVAHGEIAVPAPES